MATRRLEAPPGFCQAKEGGMLGLMREIIERGGRMRRIGVAHGLTRLSPGAPAPAKSR